MTNLQAELDDVKVELDVLQDTLDAVKEAALADGMIDDYEQEEIDDLNKLIREAKSECDAIEAEIKAETEEESPWDKLTDAVEDFFGGDDDAEAAADTGEPNTVPAANDEDQSYGEGAEDYKEDASLGQDLLELHRDLYQEFLNAGDPLNPDMITGGQETILEEMRIVSEELAIEAERSVLAHKFDATDGLDGQELVDEHQRAQFEEDGDYNEDLNEETPDDETDDGPATDTYDEMRQGGIGNEDASIDELLLDGLSEENRLMLHGELDQEMIDARIEQVRKVRGISSGVKIHVTMDGDRIVGFNYDGESNDGKEWGKLYLDLNGNQIAREWDTTSIPGEVLFLGIEIASSILVPPIEVLYDVRDLYDATLEYSQAKDGSMVPLIVTASAVLVPRMMGSKRFFKIGKKLVEASKLAAVIKKGATGEALEGIGITAAKKEGSLFDNLLENAEITDESSDLGRRLADDPEVNQQAIQEAIDAADRGIAEELAGGIVQKADPYKDFLERKSVTDVLKRMEDEGLDNLDEIGVTPKQLRDWVGEGTDEDVDWARNMLRDKLQGKLDDRAFDDMIDPGELPDDWHKNITPDLEKKYGDGLDSGNLDPDDLPDEFLEILEDADPANMSEEARKAVTEAWDKKYREMLEAKGVDTAKMSEEALKKAAKDLEENFYDALDTANKKLGFTGTPKEVKAGLKRLKTLISQGMQKEFKDTWAAKAASSKAAQQKMKWVDKYLERLSDLADRQEGLDSASDQAMRLAKQAEETRKHMNEIARSAFSNVRPAFWREVNANSRDIFESAGLKVESGGSAPVLESIGQSITVEHKDRLQDVPWRAIDADNMTFSFSYENSVLLEQQRKLTQDRMRELGHDGDIPWL